MNNIHRRLWRLGITKKYLQKFLKKLTKPFSDLNLQFRFHVSELSSEHSIQ